MISDLTQIIRQTNPIFVRKAKSHEFDTIFQMGFDVWNDSLSFKSYLLECHDSDKYASGTWYVLVNSSDDILSSLIVYSDIFGLQKGCFGIGSIATSPDFRRYGYASQLITLVRSILFTDDRCQAIYLHSDIDKQFYEKLGFQNIGKSDCMICKKKGAIVNTLLPKYF